MTALRIAWRNIMRNPRRTLITSVAVMLNTAVLIVLFAMMDGMLLQTVHNATQVLVGDVQLHAPGYRADRSMYKSLPDPENLLSLAKDRGLAAVARSYGFGLVSRDSKSAGGLVLGG